MGRRSRRRTDSEDRVAIDRQEPVAGSGLDRPRNPLWGTFPMAELAVALALVLSIVAYVLRQDRDHRDLAGIFFAIAIALGTLAGLELTLREHLSGYRSHAGVIGGIVGVLTLGVGAALGLPRLISVVAAALAFMVTMGAMRQLFQARQRSR